MQERLQEWDSKQKELNLHEKQIDAFKPYSFKFQYSMHNNL
jgi:hypothetical protein